MGKMKIKGFQVDTGEPHYVDGHTLTENEIVALNGLRNENIGHIVRANLGEDFRSLADTPEAEQPGAQERVQAAFDEVAPGYEFGSRRGGGRSSMDPVEQEARTMARLALAAKVGQEKWDGFDRATRSALVSQNWHLFQKKAEEVVNTRSKGAAPKLNLEGAE